MRALVKRKVRSESETVDARAPRVEIHTKSDVWESRRRFAHCKEW